MHSLDESLYVAHDVSAETQQQLEEWSAAISIEPPQEPVRWHLRFRRYMRSVTVSSSTAIEGNPMSAPEVDALLSGETVSAPHQAQLEVLNYNRALNLATAFAASAGHEWQHSTISAINSTVMEGLPDDRQGRYRDEGVTVAGVYQAPGHASVRSLMDGLITWLRNNHEHPLVRVALLHLNLVAIHPFLDGNGRTARVLSSLELMNAGVRAPELLSVESYLAAHRDEYFEVLRVTLGPSFQPDRHSASEWVAYYARISTALLDMDNRMEEAFPQDMGVLTDLLLRRGEPIQWAPVLHIAATAPLRTREVAEMFERSLPWARTVLNDIVEAGWLRQQGRTRASQWLATQRLTELDLRIPYLMRRYEQGQTLGLEAA